MVEKLSFGEPFIETAYLEAETAYRVEGTCLVVNLERAGGQSLTLGGALHVAPLRCAVARDTELSVPGRALLIRNFGGLSLDDLETLDCLRAVWKSARPGYPYYKSPKEEPAAGVRVNFCLVSEPNRPSGIHRTHDVELDELHVQICGTGAVDVLRENDPDTVLASLPLAAGCTHDAAWDARGEYPWHRYRSVTRSIFLCVELLR